MCIIGAATTDFGPMALYCWTRCAENGIHPDYTNGGTNSKIYTKYTRDDNNSSGSVSDKLIRLMVLP